MKFAAAAAVVFLVLFTYAVDSSMAQEPFVGEIRLFPYNFAPRGWMRCEGQLLPILQYQALFALFGTTFGGDGRTSFQLPNLREGPAANTFYYIALQGVFPSRK